MFIYKNKSRDRKVKKVNGEERNAIVVVDAGQSLKVSFYGLDQYRVKLKLQMCRMVLVV